MKNKMITSRDVDFAQWYTDIVKNAHLADYSSVKGCLILEPNGYAIWETIQSTLDKEFKNFFNCSSNSSKCLFCVLIQLSKNTCLSA